jgi:threonyl-tRNA synthetase
MNVAQEVRVALKDGQQREYAGDTTLAQVAADISPRLGREAVAAVVDGKVVDLARPLCDVGTAAQAAAARHLEFLTLADAQGLEVMRHTCAHILAQAVLRLYPGAKCAIGPVIDEGFYYDFADCNLTSDDFPRIEAEMQTIIAADYPIVREVVERAAASERFAAQGDRFKVEIVRDLPPDETVTLYHQGEFTDLCRGPHLPSTGRVRAFTLLSLAGAYWRGDASREQLTRVYATAFAKKSELDAYLQLLTERRERDHRRLGKEQKLFTLAPQVGSGLPLWLPNGARVRRVIERYIVDLEESLGYEHVYTPVLGNIELYRTSGHLDHYQEDMFPVMQLDNEQLVLRPMNCPHHMMVYKSEPRSYRDLPLRIAELGLMHRYELSGTLAGLQRVRAMTLNDAHIFCTIEQIQAEAERVVALIQRVYRDFAIADYSYRLSLRDPADHDKYIADDAMWDQAETMLRETLRKLGLNFFEAAGEAAFYGPKLDVQVKTALGREETLSTLQLDFNLPEKFDLTYVGEDGKLHRPVVLHRGIVSTMERMMAYLIENYKGAFPVWLAPVQVRVMNVAQPWETYAGEVVQRLQAAGLRAQADVRHEKIGYKIRAAQSDKVPYMLVVGEKEASSDAVAVRARTRGDIGAMQVNEFIAQVQKEIADKVS